MEIASKFTILRGHPPRPLSKCQCNYILTGANKQFGGIFFQELAIGVVFCTFHPGFP